MAGKAAMRRWADEMMDDEDGGGLPAGYTTKQDKDGVKTIVEFYYNDQGQPMRRSTKVRVVTVERKVYTVSKERREWGRFGAAQRESASDSISVQAQENIPFERVVATKATTRDKVREDLQTALQGNNKAAITGNLRDMLYKKRMERELLRAKGLLGEAEKAPDEDGAVRPGLGAGPKPGSYVPPSVRALQAGGAAASEVMAQRRNQENSIRVSNLSEEVSEDDLQELFRPFGPVSRIYLATDRVTGESRGFAFVNYHRREDAERAIKVLDGYGYAHLVLRVDWAQPRAERPFGT